jgi:Hypothetical protein (DUF2513)
MEVCVEQALQQKNIEMQRDMDLIRDLLLRVEAEPLCDGRHFVDIVAPGRSVEEVDYHLKLLVKAGYLEGTRTWTSTSISSLTWDGHEFLDNIKDSGIWSKTKERAKEIPGVALKVVAEIAMSEVRKRLGL